MSNDPRSLVPTSFFKRLTQAMHYDLSGGWFSPERPLDAQQPQTAGRALDYLAGYNISTQPRRDSGVNFQTLRNFAQYYDLLHLLIEKRMDQISNFDWSIVPSDESIAAKQDDKELQAKADSAKKFLKFPDGRLPWNTWLRKVINDMLVLDAIALWPVYVGKKLVRLETIDPATIKIVIDESGRTPEPPDPAYQQVLHGVPTADFTAEELLYFVSNPASNRIYGFSKVEQILVTVQIGLRREMSQLQFFTDGNVPAALIGVPETWPANRIAELQTAFDSMLSGNTAAKRKLWFLPGEVTKSIKELRSEEATLKAAFDEWLMRIMCFCFGISPTAFINQVNRATAFSASEEAREEGLGPTLAFLKSVIDTVIIKALKIEGVEFKWEITTDIDPGVQAEIDDKQVKNGTRSIDEIRVRDGYEPLNVGPMIFLPSGPIHVSAFADGAQPAPATALGGAAVSAGPKTMTEGEKAPPKRTENSTVDQKSGTVDEPLQTKKGGRAGSAEPFRTSYALKKAVKGNGYSVSEGRRVTRSITQGRLAKKSE